MDVLTALASSTPDRWGDIPTWIAGIGTFAAVAVALWIARRDGARRDAELKRHQAALVTAWLELLGGPADRLGERPTMIAILNGSQQLAYRVIASLVPVRGAIDPKAYREVAGHAPWEFRAFVGELPPGKHTVTVQYPGSGMSIRWAVELAFRDGSGRAWLRAADGRLQEIEKDPADYYGLHEPLPW